MHARSGKSAEAGFTLIEVMISILLAMVAVIGIIGMYRVQTRASSNSRHVTEATVLGSDRIEQLRTTTSPASLTETGIDERGVAGGIFTRTATVTATPTYDDLVVDVSWSEEGATKHVILRARRSL